MRRRRKKRSLLERKVRDPLRITEKDELGNPKREIISPWPFIQPNFLLSPTINHLQSSKLTSKALGNSCIPNPPHSTPPLIHSSITSPTPTNTFSNHSLVTGPRVSKSFDDDEDDDEDNEVDEALVLVVEAV